MFNLHKVHSILWFLILLAACEPTYKKVKTTNVPMDSLTFENAEALPLLKDKAIDEASGITASWHHNNAFWAHNDSGDAPRIFLISTDGETLATVYLENIEARDWEDIALNVEDSIAYIYIAETGDNREVYEDKYIYRFAEPFLENGETEIYITDIETIRFAYPEKARDAESLLIDPLTRDIIVVSKREKFSKIFELKYPYSKDTVNILVEKGELPFRNTVAGDISADGKEVLLKTYDEVFYWKRKGNESIAKLLITDCVRIPYLREPQGEAIAWSKAGDSFFTLSEEYQSIPARFYRYKKR